MKKADPYKERPTPFVRSQSLNYDTNAAGDESGLACPEPTLTQQHFAEETDINFIAEKFGLTGEMPQVLDMPRYGDFTGIFDYQTAQNAIVEANRQFMTLPAKVRNRFQNDPQQLMAFLDDLGNEETFKEAEYLGLVQKRPEELPQSPLGEPGPKGDPEAPLDSPKGSGEPTPSPKKGKN